VRLANRYAGSGGPSTWSPWAGAAVCQRAISGDFGLGRVGVGEGAPLGWDADGLVEPFDPAGQAKGEEQAPVQPAVAGLGLSL